MARLNTIIATHLRKPNYLEDVSSDEWNQTLEECMSVNSDWLGLMHEYYGEAVTDSVNRMAYELFLWHKEAAKWN